MAGSRISPGKVYDVNQKTGALILGSERLDDYVTKYLNTRCRESHNDMLLCDTVVRMLSEFFIVSRESVKYRLMDKGISAVPILQSICRWSGAYNKEDVFVNQKQRGQREHASAMPEV